MSATDSMVTLQERMVNLIGQLTMPVSEVALVLQHHIQGLLGSLNEYAEKTGATISDRVSHPWPIEERESNQSPITFDVEKVLKIVDQRYCKYFTNSIYATGGGSRTPPMFISLVVMQLTVSPSFLASFCYIVIPFLRFATLSRKEVVSSAYSRSVKWKSSLETS